MKKLPFKDYKFAIKGLRYLTLSILILCFVSFVLMPNKSKVVLRTSCNLTEIDVVHQTTVEQNFTIPPAVQTAGQRTPTGMWRPYLKEILDRFPTRFSSEFRNPCWYEGNELQCVPYFYQLGSFKCGTTDLWDKLVQHPDVLPVAKEPHWWALRRFGFTATPIHRDLVLETRKNTGQGDDRSLQWYLNLYRTQTEDQIKKNPKLVFGDASISNLWGLGIYDWKNYFPNETIPPVYLADLIHAVQPNVKLVVILREPVDKMWTTYMIRFRDGNLTPEHFDENVEEFIKESGKCESANNPSYCAFVRGSNPASILGNRLYQGVYYLYLREWIDVFGLENIHVMRLEDWKRDAIGELEKLFRYLELEPLPRETIQSITSRSIRNVNQKAKKLNYTMLPSTRRKLEDFYRPWNEHLAELLMDQKYKWGY